MFLGQKKLWRYLTDFWTIMLFVLIIINILSSNQLGKILPSLSVIYIAVLGLYVGTKEFERWQDNIHAKRLGEIYVYLWTILLFILIVLGIFRSEQYHISPEIITTYLAVLSIYALGSESRIYYNKKKQR